jgi:D-glycero-D-manno-heptose 1,7-bisphosphate phosphatase
MTQKRRAIFLDRDGTLNQEVGYITQTHQFRLYDCAAEAVRLINEAGWLAVVITNQAGIARGLYTESFLDELHETMRALLNAKGAQLDGIYYCPHLTPDRFDAEELARAVALQPYRIVCDCRKPKPGMLLRAAQELEIDLAASIIVGDRYGDVAAAHAAGARGALLMTGHGQEEITQREQWPRPPEFVAGNLLKAVKKILSSDIRPRTSDHASR